MGDTQGILDKLKKSFSVFNFQKQKKSYSTETGAFHEKPRLAFLLPWAHVFESGPNTGLVWGKDNSMMVVYKFRGPDMDSATAHEMMVYSAAINNFFKTLPSGYVLYFDAQRHISSDYDYSNIDVPIVQMMEDERRDYYLSQKHYETSFYFVICHEPPSIEKSKITSLLMEDAKSKGKNGSMKALNEAMTEFVNEANLLGDMLRSVFKDVRPLNAEETATYLHSTISTVRYKNNIRVNNDMYLSCYLPDCGILGGRSMKIGNKYMKVICIKNYRSGSTPGIFDIFNNLNIEYRWVSRFICVSKLDAENEIKDIKQREAQQQYSLLAIAREAITKQKDENARDETATLLKEDASAALLELGQDYVSFGHYNVNMMVFDEDEEKCQDKANKVYEIFKSLGYTGYIEQDNALEAWWGSVPGCWKANVRDGIVSSMNFCHQAPVTATWPGDEKNYHLNAPVLLYTDTTGYTPFRLSLHVGEVGHTMICGPTGAGKSVLLNTIEAHFLKYPNSNVYIFDKSMSSRALTLAVGGNFYNIASEGAGELSFQPLARIDDEQEIKWAKEWILGYIGQKNIKITPAIDNFVWKALLGLKEFPTERRTLSSFCEMVQSKEIREALIPLTKKGSYGKLFDNSEDKSGEGRWQAYEMETLMATPAIVPSTLMYLFHRIETRLKTATGPSMIILDEAWLFLDNPIFKEKLREYFKDMRKKNCSVIFATQNLSDLSSKPELLHTVMDNCPNRIYLPNKNAMTDNNKELYKSFGLNERQIELIGEVMTPKRDYYYSSEKGNRIFQLALQKIELPFVTATSKNDQQNIDRILSQHEPSDFIHQWLLHKNLGEEWEKFSEKYLDSIETNKKAV